jgi:hypothetical protein
MEEQRKIAFSQAVFASGESSMAKAEHAARTSSAFMDAVNALDDARRAAATAKAKVTYMAARLDVWRTRSATARQKMVVENGS